MSVLEKGLEAMIKASTQTTNMLTQSSTTLNSFMQTTGQVLNSNTQAIARLETQLGQLAATVSEREKGKFPSQPVANPKDTGSSSNNPAQLNAIHTLRSGKQIDNQVRMPLDQTPSPIQHTPSDEAIPSDGKNAELEIEPDLDRYRPVAPFQTDSNLGKTPRRLRKS